MSRRTIVSSISALMLTAAIAGPALSAAPTFTGSLWCMSIATGTFQEQVPLVDATKKDIAAAKKLPVITDDCEKGTVEFIETV